MHAAIVVNIACSYTLNKMGSLRNPKRFLGLSTGGNRNGFFIKPNFFGFAKNQLQNRRIARFLKKPTRFFGFAENRELIIVVFRRTAKRFFIELFWFLVELFWFFIEPLWFFAKTIWFLVELYWFLAEPLWFFGEPFLVLGRAVLVLGKTVWFQTKPKLVFHKTVTVLQNTALVSYETNCSTTKNRHCF